LRQAGLIPDFFSKKNGSSEGLGRTSPRDGYSRNSWKQMPNSMPTLYEGNAKAQKHNGERDRCGAYTRYNTIGGYAEKIVERTFILERQFFDKRRNWEKPLTYEGGRGKLCSARRKWTLTQGLLPRPIRNPS